MAKVERAKAYLRNSGCHVKSASDTRFTYYVTGLAGEYTADQLVGLAERRGMEPDPGSRAQPLAAEFRASTVGGRHA
jgi:hypothetical protein